ncbi:unnamed protein product [Clonostachys rosea]|uniref:Zn(2)-C6 fungal-type domain-containing protein n=1 Tax=Bionectria ochroleuca TaxID=29856 RepID=A0ABY6UWM8_BIOOC|nr:unnamed protein product [Clonostachys rosea]
MPRPKVPAHQRQRVAEACNHCRETKRRCTGSPPCTQCLRRGLAQQCYVTYAPRGSRARARRQLDAVVDSSSQVPQRMSVSAPSAGVVASSEGDETDSPNQASQRRLSLVGSSNFQPLSPSDSRPDSDAGASPSIVHTSRMLLNLRGERVFIGGAASISFLQTVRGLVAEQIGPSPFSHNEKSETMLEVESPRAIRDPEPDTREIELSEDQRLHYMRCYYAVTEGFLHVFDSADLEDLVKSNGQRPNEDSKTKSPLRQAAADLVIAIGAQSESASTARSVGQRYFTKARERAFASFLEDPDLDMARTFLLMAFYMLGECRRNSAFMYLGIAVKAALALGLHSRASFGQKPGHMDLVRLRVWLSICVVDKIVNSILGRPSTTARIDSNSESLLQDVSEPLDDTIDWLVASNSIVTIINEAKDKIYDQKEITTPVIENLLQAIDRWKWSLPESVGGMSLTGDQQPGVRQSGVIAKVHISCLYYFAVTLVTRPILMSTLASQSPNENVPSQLATACLDAAMYLSQTCLEALNAGLLQGNMCIMKALIFAAGLVLGFEVFAKRSVEKEIEGAFHDSKEVLKFLSAQSPQAAHYLEILSSLSSAISRRRASEPGTRKSRYVSKLFSLASSPANPEVQAQDEETYSCQTLFGTPRLEDTNWSFPEIDSGELNLDWESLNISQWDSFPFV